MNSITRYAAVGSATALLALSLSACGGDAPTDASTDAFCDAHGSLFDAFADVDSEASESEQAEQLADGYKEYADKLEETGTPEGISDDAREGFEITVDKLGDLDSDDIEKAIKDGNDDFADISDDEQEKLEAFEQYANEECGSPEAPAE